MVKPGEVLVPSAPVPVSATATATQGVLGYGFDVTGGPLDRQTGKGRWGTGAPLTLVPVPVQPRAAQNVDIDYDNNVADSTISTGLVADVAAVGADVHGTVGRGLPITVGVRNSGDVPTTAMPDAPSARDTAVAIVLLPTGVAVTGVPRGCQSLDLGSGLGSSLDSALGKGLGGVPALVGRARAALATPPPTQPGPPVGAMYSCWVDQVLRPGQSGLFTFTVKPGKVLDRAQGMVFAGGPTDDMNPQDDVAELTVSAAAPAASATPGVRARPRRPPPPRRPGPGPEPARGPAASAAAWPTPVAATTRCRWPGSARWPCCWASARCSSPPAAAGPRTATDRSPRPDRCPRTGRGARYRLQERPPRSIPWCGD